MGAHAIHPHVAGVGEGTPPGVPPHLSPQSATLPSSGDVREGGGFECAPVASAAATASGCAHPAGQLFLLMLVCPSPTAQGRGEEGVGKGTFGVRRLGAPVQGGSSPPSPPLFLCCTHVGGCHAAASGAAPLGDGGGRGGERKNWGGWGVGGACPPGALGAQRSRGLSRPRTAGGGALCARWPARSRPCPIWLPPPPRATAAAGTYPRLAPSSDGPRRGGWLCVLEDGRGGGSHIPSRPPPPPPLFTLRGSALGFRRCRRTRCWCPLRVCLLPPPTTSNTTRGLPHPLRAHTSAAGFCVPFFQSPTPSLTPSCTPPPPPPPPT